MNTSHEPRGFSGTPPLDFRLRTNNCQLSLPPANCQLPPANCLLATSLSPHLQARFRILKILADEPALTQRELAVRLGISLGKSNYLLKALIEKGLIKLGNFQRAEHKLGYVYLLTPAGIRERLRLTSAYLARKEAEYDALKAEIEELKGEAHSIRNGRRAA